jgi:hypothetical protein
MIQSNNPRQLSFEKQCGYHDIRIQHHPCYLFRLLAHWIASPTSFSVRPSFFIFSLTRSREDGTGVIFTGVKRIVLSLMVTSKYSASGKTFTISLGKVIWFLDVFLASTIPYFLIVRVHYYLYPCQGLPGFTPPVESLCSPSRIHLLIQLCLNSDISDIKEFTGAIACVGPGQTGIPGDRLAF